MRNHGEWQWRSLAALLRLVISWHCLVLVFDFEVATDVIGASEANGAFASVQVLSQIDQIRALDMDQARSHRQVHVEGVLTFSDPDWSLFFVQDVTAGIYVMVSDLNFTPGQIVEVDGIADQGGYAPFIKQVRLKGHGVGSWPVPKRVGYTELMTGKYDSQWVEVEGVVSSASSQGNRAIFGLSLNGGEVKATIVNAPDGMAAELLDARIKVRAVCSVQGDENMRVKAVQLFSPSFAHVTVLQKGVPNQFAEGIKAIGEVSQRPLSSGPVRIQGVVTKCVPGQEFTLRDRTGTILVHSQQTDRLKTDLLVDLIGDLIEEKGTAAIIERKFRSLGMGLPLPPEQLAKLQRASISGISLKVLRNIASVRLLNEQEASQGYPLVLNGVVTYYDAVRNDCFVQDGTGGIWVDTESTVEFGLGLSAGDLVEVEGYSAPGYAPALVHPHFQILGRKQLPDSEVLGLPQLLTGKEDAQWVKLVGLVRSIETSDAHVALILEMGNGGTLKVVVNGQRDPGPFRGLVAATIQVQGVCSTLFNHKHQLTGVELLVPNTNQVRVLSEASADLSTIPLQQIQNLLKYEPQGQAERRVRVEGVVMLVRSSKSLFIHDSSDGIYLETQEPVSVKPGDWVEVVGFPSVGDFSPVLHNAVCIAKGSSPLPPAASPSIAEIVEGKFDSELIRMEATYLEQTPRNEDVVLTLRAQQRVFDAYIPAAKAGEVFRNLRQGAQLRLTGVCSVQVDENRQPKSFRLLLRGPEDLKVVKTPSAWIFIYAYRVMAALAMASLAAFAWVVMLRNRVQHQTEIIRLKLVEEASLEKRFRGLFENANDLVFSVDLDGRWLSMNTAVERVLGLQRSRVAGQSVSEVIAPTNRDRFCGMIARLKNGQNAVAEEVDMLGAHGEEIVLEISARIQSDEGPLPPRIDCIARNITDRKRADAELKLTQAQLIQASRLAGMSEVATGVLHNVGNVLNSVNVSATLLGQSIKRSKVAQVAKLADLLDQHVDDLGAFIAQDPKGKELHGYLRHLGDHLDKERSALLSEVDALHRNVEHINKVIARQQEYAKVSGVTEKVKVHELIDQAVEMNADRLAKRHIEVVRDYEPQITDITVEKHKVLQILVNLIRNAEYACEASHQGDRRLWMRASRQNGGVRFSVEDNGIGITAENLKRIFNHGFTTRKDGHGFGLHHGVLAAREMGGSLTVHSDGPGRGAIFALDLPLSPTNEREALRNRQSMGSSQNQDW